MHRKPLALEPLEGRLLLAIVLPSLPTGSRYQLVFVTAEQSSATSTDIGFYNTIASRNASDNPDLPSATWKAWVSTSTVNARDNAPVYGDVPIFNTRGELVAGGLSEFLYPTHRAAIMYDQFGFERRSTVATGSSYNGFSAIRGAVGNFLGNIGYSDGSGEPYRWVSAETNYVSTARSFYALSSVITVGGPSVPILGPPQNLTAIPSGNTVSLSWKPPLVTDGSQVIDYVIQYSRDAGQNWITYSDDISPATEALVSGLENGTSYAFSVAARSRLGNGSYSTTAVSAPTASVTAPSQPRALVGVSDNSGVDLYWDSPLSTGNASLTDYIVQYRLASAGTWSTYSDGTSTSTVCRVTGLSPGAGYLFRVAARNTAVTGSYSDESSIVYVSYQRPDVLPGAEYQVIFVSAERASAQSASISDYNALVTRNGTDNTSLPAATWRAWASTATVDARVNAPVFPAVPIFNTRGQKVANGSGDFLYPTHLAPVLYDQFGFENRTVVATGSSYNGYSASGSSLGGFLGNLGYSYASNTPNEWVSAEVNYLEYSRAFYGLSGKLVAPPASPLPAAPSGVSGMAGSQRVWLSWMPPRSWGLSVITDYVISYSSDGGNTWVVYDDGVSTSRSCIVQGLTNGVSYVFKVAATNGSGVSAQSEASPPVTPVANVLNASPTDIVLSATTLAENAGANAVVGTLTTADPDAGNNFTYALVAGTGSNDNAAFNILGNQLRATDGLNFETKSSYSVRLRSTDQDGLFTEKVFGITVSNVNETPTDIMLSPAPRVIDGLVAWYPMEGDANDASGNNANGRNLTGAVQYVPGQVGLAGWFDGQSSILLPQPRLLDGATSASISAWIYFANSRGGQIIASGDGRSGADPISTRINPLSAEDLSFAEVQAGSNSLTLNGKPLPGLSVGSWHLFTVVLEQIADRSIISSYVDKSLAAQATSTSFSRVTYDVDMAPMIGAIQATNPTQFWNGGIDDLRVYSRALNKAEIEQLATINAIVENAGANAVVGTLSTIDPDAGDTFTYTLVSGADSTDNASFNISGNQLRATASLDFEAKSSYTVRVRSTDQGGLFTEKAFTINVTNVNEAATAVTLTPVLASLPENNSTATSVKLADITVADDALGTNALSLSGVDASSFEIVGTSLYLKAGVGLDYETVTRLTVTVSASDATLPSSLPVTTLFTLDVLDVLDDVALVTPAGSPPMTMPTLPTGSLARIVKQGLGTLILDKSNSHTGGTVVEAGELIVRNIGALGTGTLDVRAGAKVTFDVGSVNWNGGANYVQLSRLELDPAGRLEVGTGQIRMPAGTYNLTAIRSALSSGRNGGAWNGAAGFTSTSAGLGTSRAIGYRVMPSTNELRLGFAALGDANLDGQVSFSDISLINNGGRFGQGKGSNPSWSEGDFNYSGDVTFSDISLLNNAGVYGIGSYLPVAPSSQSATTTDTGTISTDLWAAYALTTESKTVTKKR